MSGGPAREALERLREALPPVERFEYGPVDVPAACAQYAEAGYPVTDQLRGFLGDYAELELAWLFEDWEELLDTTVETALSVPARNVRIDADRVGKPLLPIGRAFDTEEAVLLAPDGEVLLGGDAGMQRVAYGFPQAVKAIVTGEWDKTFF
ncbi:SUKH-3 domain-containing protein [Phaeacidiphilus oryzae]|uniref:SUKH-3 domain-containing protein n=1 Tax=Phaeacidiphilus oryzae TaxID=348818 RepID=UPI0005619B23|nr:SUKH-3 domain-containing protein [Phaeacidiphilus oryzae]